MAFNGSGTYSRLYNWVNDAAANVKIRSDKMDAEMDGFATGLSTCITKDGQTTVTANLPMSSYKHTGVGNATARTHYASAGQVADGSINWVDGGGTADAITATNTIPITTLIDGQLCHVRATAANATTTPTFAPDGLTARTIVKNGGSALVAGDIAGDGHELILRYNLSGTKWELLNPAGAGFATKSGANTFSGINTHTAQVRWAKGADVASAGALTLGTDGNYFDITGTTTITSIGTLGAGTAVKLHFDGTLTLTHHATDLILPGGANITTAAGDEAEFVEYATGDWRCTSYTAATGKAVVPSVTAATQADQETSTSTTTYVSPGRQQFHPASAKAWVKFTTVTTTSILASYNITSLTDNGTGDTTITIATDFSSAHYAYAAMSEYDNGLVNGDGNTPAAGTLRVVHQGSTNSTPFDGIMSVIMFGDQ